MRSSKQIIDTPLIRIIVYGGFLLALLTMIAISVLTYRSNLRQASNFQAIAASIQVTSDIDTLNVYLRDAETGQRGYLITGDESYLTPYTAALDNLTTLSFKNVASHATVDQVKETELLDQADQLTQKKLAELKQTIELRRSTGFSAAQKVVLTNLGRDLMTSILTETNTVKSLEDQRVAENVAANKAQTASLTNTTLAGNAITLALVLTSLIVLGISAAQRQKDHEEIISSEERFAFLVRATNEAVWDRNLRTDEVLWNDGIQRLFGYSQSPSTTRWSWLEGLIHPDDRERTVRSLHQAITDTQEIWNGQYRLLKQDGTYASVLDRALIIRDTSGMAIRIVGSIQDVSEQQTYEEKIIKRARELERINRLMTGRELKMRELKQEIVALKNSIEHNA